MQSISVWIINIVGICLFSVVIDLILPSGKTNIVIKRIVSYCIILVVLMPIPSFLKKDFDLYDYFNNNQIQIQENYIYNLNQTKLDDLKSVIENEITNNGILGTVVSISANIFDYDMKIDAIYVDLYFTVITDGNKNINIKKVIKDIVKSNIKIEEDKIIFYEWKNKE